MWADSRQSLCSSLTQYRESEEASDKEPNYLWPFWVAEYAHLKGRKPHSAKAPFVMRWLKGKKNKCRVYGNVSDFLGLVSRKTFFFLKNFFV